MGLKCAPYMGVTAGYLNARYEPALVDEACTYIAEFPSLATKNMCSGGGAFRDGDRRRPLWGGELFNTFILGLFLISGGICAASNWGPWSC